VFAAPIAAAAMGHLVVAPPGAFRGIVAPSLDHRFAAPSRHRAIAPIAPIPHGTRWQLGISTVRRAYLAIPAPW
jgi:hypothetical protein